MSNATDSTPRTQATARTIVANIRAELGYIGKPQSALAPIFGKDEMWISRRMNTSVEFTGSELAMIADYFGVEPGELFTVRRAGGRNIVGVTPIRPRFVGRTGLEPVTDGSWVAPVTPIRKAS